MIEIRDGVTGDVLLAVEAADLPGQERRSVRLTNGEFADLDLSRVVLSYSSLRQMNFRKARLSDATLNNTFMVDVCFEDAIMDGVDLSEATIMEGTFRRAIVHREALGM